MEFVTRQDVDFQAFIEEKRLQNFSLREKHEPLLVDVFGRYCEKAIKLMLNSDPREILKYKSFGHGGTWKPFFKEFDYHLPDKKVVGELKVSFNRSSARKKAQKQREAIRPKTDELNYTVQIIIVEVSEAKEAVESLIIDDSPLIYLNAYAMFQYCLDQKIIEDVDLFDKMMVQDRSERVMQPAKIYKTDDKPTTLGDLFNFEF